MIPPYQFSMPRQQTDDGVDLLKDPTPAPPPAAVVAGPSGAVPPVAPPLVSGPAVLGGANIGALDKQAGKIEKAGEDIMGLNDETQQKLAPVADARKTAIGMQVDAAEQRAHANEAAFDDQLSRATSLQDHLAEIKKGEDEAVKVAKEDSALAKDDAIYGNMSREARLKAMATEKDSSATYAQKAAARASLEKGQKIDPDQYLGSAGAKITAALAMAMGAMGAAFTGGPNYAMQIIQGAIQDNIDAQKANFAKKRGEADDAHAHIGEVEGKFDKDRQWALKQNGIGLEMAKLKLSKMMAGLDGTEAFAKGQEQMAMIDEEIIRNEHAYELAVRGDHLGALQASAGVMTNAAQLREQRADRLADANKQGNGKPLPEGGIKDLASAEAALERVKQLRADFKSKTGKFSFLAKYIPGTDADIYENNRKLVAQEFTNALSGTGASNEEREQILTTFPGAQTPEGKADAMFDSLTARVMAKYSAIKKQSEAQGYAVPAAGRQSQQVTSQEKFSP
jgi:hypothetical protein